MVLTATMETFIGLALVSGKFLRTGLVVLATAFVGIMSPVVLFAGDMFGDGPTLEAQYVLKDVVLIAAGLVVGAKALGARSSHPDSATGPDRPPSCMITSPVIMQLGGS